MVAPILASFDAEIDAIPDMRESIPCQPGRVYKGMPNDRFSAIDCFICAPAPGSDPPAAERKVQHPLLAHTSNHDFRDLEISKISMCGPRFAAAASAARC